MVVRAPLQGTVVAVPSAVGATVAEGAPVVILESMKMEHVVRAPASGIVRSLSVEAGIGGGAGDAVGQ